MKLPSGWREVPLASFARPVRRRVTVQAKEGYRTLGVHWYAKGPYERQTKQGRDIAAKYMYRVAESDLIINRIWVRNGSIGIIPPELEGYVVTSDFPTFELDQKQVEPEYLRFFTQVSALWEICEKLSRGTSGRQRIKQDDFLSIKIPLPPLPIQRRIVGILKQADELRRKHAQADELTGRILPALFVKMFGDPVTNPMEWEVVRLGDIVLPTETRNPNKTPEEPFTYIEIGSVENTTGRIVEPRNLLGSEAPSRARKVIREGDVIVATTRPYLKNTALIPPDLDGQICYTGFCVLRCSDSLNNKVLFILTRMDAFTEQLTSKMRGSSYPAVSDDDVLNVIIPLPDAELQEQFSDCFDSLTALRQRQAGRQAILNDLFEGLLSRAFRGELTAGLILQEAFSLTERQMALLRILNGAAQIQEPVLVTSAMKYAFLFQMEGTRAGQPVERIAAEPRAPYVTEPAYDFVPYKYGPFAKELYDDLEALEASGLVRTEHPPKGTSALREKTEIYLVQNQTDTIRELADSLPPGVRQAVDTVIGKYGELSQNRLLDMVYRRYPEYTVNNRWKREPFTKANE